MDYQEAIEYMRKESHRQTVNSEGQDAYIIAISAMQELQEYKQLGTLEEMKLLKATHLTGVELAKLDCAIKKLNEYKKLGTLEEVRDAVEKQREKKPKNVETGGYRYTDTYRCPTCGGNFSGTGIAEYCYHCGQRLNWE